MEKLHLCFSFWNQSLGSLRPVISSTWHFLLIKQPVCLAVNIHTSGFSYGKKKKKQKKNCSLRLSSPLPNNI